MKKLHERLEDERKRLGLSKGSWAAAGGVAGSTYTGYADGVREPLSSFFEGISKIGADVNYIITGFRVGASSYEVQNSSARIDAKQEQLSLREQALLDDFRSLSDKEKDAAETMLNAVAKPKLRM